MVQDTMTIQEAAKYRRGEATETFGLVAASTGSIGKLFSSSASGDTDKRRLNQ